MVGIKIKNFWKYLDQNQEIKKKKLGIKTKIHID